MWKIHLLGKVIPSHTGIGISQQTFQWDEPKKNRRGTFILLIENSAITMTCETEIDLSQDKNVNVVVMRAYDITRSAVNLISFHTGVGLSVVFETMIRNGTPLHMQATDPSLAQLCTAFDIAEEFSEAYTLVLGSTGLSLALADLIRAATEFNVAPTNCARTVEGIRHLVCPDTEPKVAWPIMQQRLNMTESYLSFVTAHSKDWRHGNPVKMSGHIIGELVRRSWTVMDRYLAYEKSGRQPLPLDRYPLLSD